MSVLLLVPDGVSARNFLLTDLPLDLSQLGQVDVMIGDGLSSCVDDEHGGIRNVAGLGHYPERPLEALVRRTLEYAHLRWCNTEGTRFNLEAPIPGSGRARVLRGAARSVSRVVSGPRSLPQIVRAQSFLAGRRPEVDVYAAQLAAWGTEVVLCAHQRPLSVLPVIMAAKRLGIPTVTFIFSWDNLTTKGRIAAPFDHFFVWSDQMASELSRFYPDVDGGRVHVVGSPQFEPYADEGIVWDRRHFLMELGLDPLRSVICYSGGDTLTCPEDPDHLLLLCRLIEEGKIHGNPQVLLRPAPVDRSDRYDAVLARHPVVLARPDWSDNGSGWASLSPTRHDMKVLANIVRHADLNVNMASTMTLDFALHDTPVVNLGFDIDERKRLAPRYYQFDHYRPVVEMAAAMVPRDAASLASAVNRYLRSPAADRANRRAFVDYELRVKPGQSKQAIKMALGEIISTVQT